MGISKNLLLPVHPLAEEECPDKSGRGVFKHLIGKLVKVVEIVNWVIGWRKKLTENQRKYSNGVLI